MGRQEVGREGKGRKVAGKARVGRKGKESMEGGMAYLFSSRS